MSTDDRALHLEDLTDDEIAAWRASYVERVAQRRASLTRVPVAVARAAATRNLNQVLTTSTVDEGHWFVGVTTTAGRVGTAWLRTGGVGAASVPQLCDLDLVGPTPVSAWFSAALRATLLAAAARRGGSALGVVVAGDDGPAAAITAAGPSTRVASRMVLPLSTSTSDPPPSRSAVVLADMTEDEFVVFERALITTYADDLAASGEFTATEARERSRTQTTALLAHGVHTPDHFLFTVRVSDESVGALWLNVRHLDGDARGFVYDVRIENAFQGRGWGRATMEVAAAFLRERGCDYVELNVFGFNEVARGLYDSLGYVTAEEYVLLPT